MIAKKICAANNWELEVIRLDWDSLVPAVQTGKVDAVIAGQSMTEDRMQQVDFALTVLQDAAHVEKGDEEPE